MSKLKIQGHGSGSGTLTLEAPDTNDSRTLTLPNATGTLLTSDGDGSSLTNLPSQAHTGNVAFPATQVASADANTLDDYEEGTWTPVIAGTSSAGTYTYGSAADAGRYTKIGNLVTVWGNLANIVTGSAGSGNLKVTGMPFSSASGVAYYQSCIVNNWSSAEAPKTYMGASSSTVRFYTYGDMSGALNNILITNISSGASDIRFMINYRA